MEELLIVGLVIGVFLCAIQYSGVYNIIKEENDKNESIKKKELFFLLIPFIPMILLIFYGIFIGFKKICVIVFHGPLLFIAELKRIKFR